jgi:hypothetical protein
MHVCPLQRTVFVPDAMDADPDSLILRKALDLPFDNAVCSHIGFDLGVHILPGHPGDQELRYRCISGGLFLNRHTHNLRSGFNLPPPKSVIDPSRG